MKKIVSMTAAILSLLLIGGLIGGLIFVLNGCASEKGEGLAIYLTRDDIPPSKMEALSHVDLEDRPLISLADIVTYNAQTHELKLTADAYKRIAGLEVPVRGRSFLVCVDRQPIYWGAFWTPISSMSFDGVTIWKPFGKDKMNIVTLELGYPSGSFYQGEDPRNDPAALKSLKEAGKLIDRLTLQDIEKLPGSMKQYELYSWSQDGGWYFTLITGTDRNKETAEIVSAEDFISEAGWIRIRVEGVEAFKTVLSKLNPEDSVLWLASPRTDQAPESGISFSYPPPADIQTLKALADQYGVDLQTQ